MLISLHPLICVFQVIVFLVRDLKSKQKTTSRKLCAAALYSDAFCSVSIFELGPLCLLGFSLLLIKFRWHGHFRDGHAVTSDTVSSQSSFSQYLYEWRSFSVFLALPAKDNVQCAIRASCTCVQYVLLVWCVGSPSPWCASVAAQMQESLAWIKRHCNVCMLKLQWKWDI